MDWKINILNTELDLKIDSGSEVNILNLTDFKKLKINVKSLLNTTYNLTSYTGHKIKLLGQLMLKCYFKGTEKNLMFCILDSTSPKSILGLGGAKDLNIIQIDNTINVINQENVELSHILSKYDGIFSGIGQLKKNAK